MEQRAPTDNEIASLTPEFRIDEQDRPRLTVDLKELEIHQDECGLATLECTFVNWGMRRDEGAGFLHFDDSALELGAKIVVEIDDGDEEVEIFRGFISAVGGRYGEQMPPLVVVRADDEMQRLRIDTHSRSFEDSTDEEIVERIARDHELRAETSADGARRRRAYWQLNRSDLAVVRERARAADAVVQLEGDVLTFRDRRARDEEPVELTWFDELLSFEVEADLADQRRQVHVHGYSVDEKRAIHQSAGADVVRQEANGGRTGPEVLEQLDIDADEHVHLEMPTSDEEARVFAQNLARARGRRFVRGLGTTVGTPQLRVGRPLRLQGLGPWFDGVYDLFSLRHTFDRSTGLRTHFGAERVEMGDT